MTEKLYYTDSHIWEFQGCVAACEGYKGGFRVALNRTAFFPEGGGQAADTGYIGQVRVSDVHEREGVVWHYTDAPLTVGDSLACRIDREQRLRRMQNHSGEHIVSGITHALHGLENVGFHMGESFVTIDFDRELSWEELMEIETRANEAVRADIPVKTSFPDPDALAAMEYRSKLELRENVRIVEIEGIDRCACCAPHVKRTGEIGSIKILDAMRHRGGVRIDMVCGMDALGHYRGMLKNVTEIGAMLSVKRRDSAGAVERLLEEQRRLKERSDALGEALAEQLALGAAASSGNICLFNDILDENGQRALVNRLTEKCGGFAAVFCREGEGWRYIIGSKNMDLRSRAKEINAGIDGRGGGKPEMLQGRAMADQKTIQTFVESAYV